jgi:dienelactone hydrolase
VAVATNCGWQGRRALGVRKLAKALALACMGLALTGAPSVAAAQPSPPAGGAELFPALTGRYAVGVVDLALTDPSRRELFGPQPGGPRELGLIVWYPAARAEGRRSPIWRKPEVILPAYAKAMGYPPAVADAFRSQQSHAYEGAPVARGRRFPVVIFSHGYAQGFAGQNTALCEELASHGYVVVSISHSYEAFITLLKDGEVAAGDASQVKALTDEARGPATAIDKAPVLDRSLDVWIKDTRFVVDQLPVLDRAGAPTELVKAMDTRQIAFTGMSFGGAVAPLACAEDERCKAAVNLDGFQYGHFKSQLSKPELFMTRGDDRDGNYGVFRQAKGPAAYVVVPGSAHFDFTDLPLITHPGPPAKPGGPIEGRRMVALVADFTRTFLDETVGHNPQARLADVKDHFPEVVVTTKGKLQ